MRNGDIKYKLNSDDDEFLFENHYKINNENLSPEDVAEMIIKKYNLIPEFREESENKMY